MFAKHFLCLKTQDVGNLVILPNKTILNSPFSFLWINAHKHVKNPAGFSAVTPGRRTVAVRNGTRSLDVCEFSATRGGFPPARMPHSQWSGDQWISDKKLIKIYEMCRKEPWTVFRPGTMTQSVRDDLQFLFPGTPLTETNHTALQMVQVLIQSLTCRKGMVGVADQERRETGSLSKRLYALLALKKSVESHIINKYAAMFV